MSELIELAKRVVRKSKREAEIVLIKGETVNFRFFQNEVHQPLKEEGGSVRIRVIDEKRTGFASGNSLEEEEVYKTLSKASEIAKFSPRKEDLPPLPEPSPLPPHGKTFDEESLMADIEDFALPLLSLIKKSKRNDFELSGSLQIEKTKICIVNSHGIEREGTFTESHLQVILEKGESSAYASHLSKSFWEIDFEKLFEKAQEKLRFCSKKLDFKPGVYRTILEPEAVAEILGFLSYLGFSALAHQEGRSFMRPGEKMISEQIDLWDDGLDERSLTCPFDFEGVPKKKVVFFERGVAKEFVYDTYTAAREGKVSTGHALPYPNPEGPLPLHLFMNAGNLSLKEMIEREEKAILVTRFFYTNIENHMETILTGMTRDGTFLIEEGKIKGALPNLRFTQSGIEALARVLEMSKERKLARSFVPTCYVPALKIDGFNFTGYTG